VRIRVSENGWAVGCRCASSTVPYNPNNRWQVVKWKAKVTTDTQEVDRVLENLGRRKNPREVDPVTEARQLRADIEQRTLTPSIEGK